MPSFIQQPDDLIPFIKATQNMEPDDDEVLGYVKTSGARMSERLALLSWARHQREGMTETDVCTGCWAIIVKTKPVPEWQEGLHFSTCDSCYGNVCQFCHAHDEDSDQCLCTDCYAKRKDSATPKCTCGNPADEVMPGMFPKCDGCEKPLCEDCHTHREPDDGHCYHPACAKEQDACEAALAVSGV